MYYNNLKYDKKGKCKRVIKLYCSSLDYHITLLKMENTTLDEFKLDIIGLLSSLKRYTLQNKRNLDRQIFNDIKNFSLDLNSNEDNLLINIEAFKKSIS